MNDQIICPHCKKPIPLTEALSHQLQEKYQNEYRQKYKDAMAKKEQELTVKLKEKITKEMELQIKDKANELEDLRRQNKLLQDQLLELNRLIRSLKTENEQKTLEMEKKLVAEQEKIREEEKKRQDETYRLKMLEYDKKLQDALKANDDLKRKLEQGSQQTQGEVLELELEQTLKREFPQDDIKPVAKGVRGGDIIQVVKNNNGRPCGTIIWESKRTKAWGGDWVAKLKEDRRQAKAEAAVLISSILPEGIKHIGILNGVWVTDYESILGIAIALRENLISLASVKLISVNQKEKSAVLYNYLTSTEFTQRIEAIVEAFTNMQLDIEKEKRWFASKWAKEEKSIRQVIDNTSGMYGDLQSIIGRALNEVKGLNALSSGKENNNDGELF